MLRPVNDGAAFDVKIALARQAHAARAIAHAGRISDIPRKAADAHGAGRAVVAVREFIIGDDFDAAVEGVEFIRHAEGVDDGFLALADKAVHARHIPLRTRSRAGGKKQGGEQQGQNQNMFHGNLRGAEGMTITIIGQSGSRCQAGSLLFW